MSEAKCETGWGDLNAWAVREDRLSPHPGPYLASLDSGPTLPLQGRVICRGSITPRPRLESCSS
jgi:hypothetical protein